MNNEQNTLHSGYWGLALITLFVAGLFRFTGLNWDLAQWIHPDEGHMRTITGVIKLPDQPGLYFDTARSSLNPRNYNQTYSYGTLPLFATRALAEWVERGCMTPDNITPPRLNAWVARKLLSYAGESVDTTLRGAPLCSPGTFTWTYNAFLGRHLSALADLGTVLLLFLLGRRLYGARVGLLAMALGTVTVLLIQQAHFFTVDSAATFFTTLTAYFAARAAFGATGRPPWLDLALGGVAVGLAAACKVSAVVAAGLVALAGLAWALRRRDSGDSLLRAVLIVALPLMLSGLLAGAAFRIGQPYAFDGPGFFGLHPNAAWFERLRQIGEEQNGVLDYPSGRQWANRWPVVFPLANIAIWGLGLPLGLAVAAGWATAGYQMVRGRRSIAYAHLIPWVWTTLYIAFYATRWVKAMRYFVPAYPLLIVLGAWALVEVLRMGERAGRTRRSTAATSSNVPEVARDTGRRWQWAAYALVAAVVAGTSCWAAGFLSIYLRPHTRVQGSRWIYANVPPGSALANEHWDWGLPLRIDGRDGFRDAYSEITLELYNEDTPEKRLRLLDQLDQADYLIMASNRLYGSIPRLPERYPLTTTYYRALFAGELGFELVGEFTSYIQVGPFVFPDQENPYPLMASAGISTQGHLLAVPLPPAEESFSVYDHPDCFIFHKTADYSRDKAALVLDAVDLSQAQPGLTPHEATPQWIQTGHSVTLAAGLLLVVLVTGLVVFRGPGRPPSAPILRQEAPTP